MPSQLTDEYIKSQGDYLGELLHELKQWRELGREMVTEEGCDPPEYADPYQARVNWVMRISLVVSKRQRLAELEAATARRRDEVSRWRVASRTISNELSALGMDLDPIGLVDLVLERFKYLSASLEGWEVMAAIKLFLTVTTDEETGRSGAEVTPSDFGVYVDNLIAVKNEALADRAAKDDVLDAYSAEIQAWRNMSMAMSGRPGLNPIDVRRMFETSVSFGAEQKARAEKAEKALQDKQGCSGYEELTRIFAGAFDQAAFGKGRERHASNLSWENQPLVTELRLLGGVEAAVYQVRKKAREAARLDAARGIEELRGAMVYAAAGVLYLEEVLAGAQAPMSSQDSSELSDRQKSAPLSSVKPGDTIQVMHGAFEGLRFKVRYVMTDSDKAVWIRTVSGETVHAAACEVVEP